MLCANVKRAELSPKVESKCVHPVALLRLGGVWNVTTGANERNLEFEWDQSEGNIVELYIDRLKSAKDILYIELYANWYLDEIIGRSSIEVSNIIMTRPELPKEFTVQLRGPEDLQDSFGDLTLDVWCTPPLRGPFKALKQLSKFLLARDHVLAACLIMSKAFVRLGYRGTTMYMKYSSPLMYYWMNRILSNKENRDFTDANREWIELLGGFLGGFGFGLLSIAVVVLGLLAIVALPIWIIPTFITLLWWSPIWIPVFVLTIPLVITMMFVIGFFLVTSHPVRRIAATLFAKCKHLEFGRQIFYTELNDAYANT